jgi:hypothetical protein
LAAVRRRDDGDAKESVMTWTTLTLEVTTPLFNGGADSGGDTVRGTGFRPADDAGVRVASIRGAMRFWFRALVGAATGPDLGELARLERRVFGGAADQGQAEQRPAGEGRPGQDVGGGGAASPLLLRIPRQPAVVPATGSHGFLPAASVPVNQRRRDPSRWLLYLMGQGLADMGNCIIRRPYVAPGDEFELKIGFRHHRDTTAAEQTAIETLAFASLWLTCTYGGIGARTRRGFGGVKIIGADGPLPGPWQEPGAVLSPSLGFYEGLRYLWPEGPLGHSMQAIQVLAGGRRFDMRAAWDGRPPTFPVLSRTHTQAAASGGGVFSDWSGTLVHAGEQFRHFRANKPNIRPDANYQPRIESQEWVDVVHGGDDRFPLGALGLPVVYRDDYIVNVSRGSGSEPPLRRASPLWLRPVGEGDDWRLLSFAFLGEFLPGPDAPGVQLWHQGSRAKELQVTDDDVRQVSGQWISVLQRDGLFSDGDRRE